LNQRAEKNEDAVVESMVRANYSSIKNIMRKGGDSNKKLIIRKVEDRQKNVAGGEGTDPNGGALYERQPSMVQFQLKFE
jgi:hypothetical protein